MPWVSKYERVAVRMNWTIIADTFIHLSVLSSKDRQIISSKVFHSQCDVYPRFFLVQISRENGSAVWWYSRERTEWKMSIEMVNSPNNETIWREAGLDMNLDWVMKCGDIVAYKLLWPETGEWSDWFVTRVNDLSPLSADRPTRMWSLFADHYHIFIICKSHRNKLTGDRC